jgi:hypothetical protein
MQRGKANLCLVGLMIGLQVSGDAQSPGAFTQRRINEMAAALERAHDALVEETGLRQNGETLEAYLARLAAPLPGEKPDRRKARIDAYVAALAKATLATAPARRMPALRDADAENQRLWHRITQSLAHLPLRIRHTEAAWQREQKFAGNPKSVTPHVPLRLTSGSSVNTLAVELSQTLRTLNEALDALRDARP